MLTHYARYLPHRLPPEETYFITFRLHGSLPQDVIEKLIEEKAMIQRQVDEKLAAGSDAAQKLAVWGSKRYFACFDQALDTAVQGNDWLKNPAIANEVKAAIHHYDGISYTLHVYCIMPNHVHLLITALPRSNSFFTVMKSLKGYSARRANALLSRTGQPFWQPESYDHVVRNADEFNRITEYILNNPIKAGLAQEWTDWPHAYVATQ